MQVPLESVKYIRIESVDGNAFRGELVEHDAGYHEEEARTNRIYQDVTNDTCNK